MAPGEIGGDDEVAAAGDPILGAMVAVSFLGMTGIITGEEIGRGDTVVMPGPDELEAVEKAEVDDAKASREPWAVVLRGGNAGLVVTVGDVALDEDGFICLGGAF